MAAWRPRVPPAHQRNCSGIALHSSCSCSSTSQTRSDHILNRYGVQIRPRCSNMVHNVTTWFSKHRETSVTKSQGCIRGLTFECDSDQAHLLASSDAAEQPFDYYLAVCHGHLLAAGRSLACWVFWNGPKSLDGTQPSVLAWPVCGCPWTCATWSSVHRVFPALSIPRSGRSRAFTSIFGAQLSTIACRSQLCLHSLRPRRCERCTPAYLTMSLAIISVPWHIPDDCLLGANRRNTFSQLFRATKHDDPPVPPLPQPLACTLESFST